MHESELRTTAEVLAVVDAFDSALRSRNRSTAEGVWALDRPDVSILGSAAGEEFDGPGAVAACLEALTSRSTTHGWRWLDRRVSVAGDVAWLIAEAFWVTNHADGTQTERPYRVTGVLLKRERGWQWVQYHGSEPLGAVG